MPSKLNLVQRIIIQYFSFIGRQNLDITQLDKLKIELTNQTLMTALIPFIIFDTFAYILGYIYYSRVLQNLNVLSFASNFEAAVHLILALIAFPTLYRHADEFKLFQNYYSQILVNMIFYCVTIFDYFIQPIPLVFGIGLMLVLNDICEHFISIVIPIFQVYYQKYKNRYLKFNMDYNRETYSRVLNDPKHFDALKEQLTKEMCIENGMFVEEYNRSMRSVMSSQTSLIQKPTSAVDHHATHIRLRDLFEMYFANDAPFQLNVTSEMVQSIKSQIMNLNEGSNLQIYEAAFAEINDLIYSNTFARFVQQSKLIFNKK